MNFYELLDLWTRANVVSLAAAGAFLVFAYIMVVCLILPQS